MDIALPSFILGYHGCDKKLADAVIAGKAKLDPSTNDYDWLCEGKPLYDNAGFAANTHIQIAVRTPAQILGTFHPLDEKGNRRRFK